ncbi:hypothetical protein FisN_12Lu067 [Fistulifera solaris]|uniref:Uncharacterized protein n=1 Tax=Fistulifera solaris TaxID=1519565 RepID=A0A1Z5KGN5_FISSO|nr:hypothetical protein FisN_12Lu067 [Fistulifera solaris]|eukprot:GAX25480.1 hypothetical protein FisN_12Lu067 [Fistulifera solaris]
MGNILCCTPICPPLPRQDWFDIPQIVSDQYTTPSALITYLMKIARTPHKRIRFGLINCAGGFTYILPMRSSIGKTMAAEYLVAELQGRNALYFSASGDRKIVNALQATLNTTVGSAMLAKCLVAALGTTGVARDYELPSLLIIDEVNNASDFNEAFIEDLFLGINRDNGLTCVILTNKEEEVAEALLALNQGKIRPFPGSAVEPWEPLKRPVWLRDIH